MIESTGWWKLTPAVNGYSLEGEFEDPNSTDNVTRRHEEWIWTFDHYPELEEIDAMVAMHEVKLNNERQLEEGH